MRWITRCVPKWIAPRLALALLLTGVACLLVWLTPVFFPGDPSRRPAVVVDAPASRCPLGMTTAAIRCEVNAFRRASELPPVRPVSELRAAAQFHARDMVQRRYFAHAAAAGPTLNERVRRAGYLRHARDFGLGENIAWGQGQLAEPAQIVAAWMASPGHRRIMLTRNFREAGVGIVGAAPQGGAGATYVLDVGYRR